MFIFFLFYRQSLLYYILLCLLTCRIQKFSINVTRYVNFFSLFSRWHHQINVRLYSSQIHVIPMFTMYNISFLVSVFYMNWIWNFSLKGDAYSSYARGVRQEALLDEALSYLLIYSLYAQALYVLFGIKATNYVWLLLWN